MKGKRREWGGGVQGPQVCVCGGGGVWGRHDLCYHGVPNMQTAAPCHKCHIWPVPPDCLAHDFLVLALLLSCCLPLSCSS